MKVKLTEYEQRMLNGEFGEFKQVALQNIVKYAEVLGAEELCEVTKATVYLGAHPYLDVVNSDNYDEIFSEMLLCSDKTVKIDKFCENCFSQTCVAPCDQYVWEPLNLTEEFYKKNKRYLEITKEAGVSITGSCTPYLIGWIPLKGEHFVTTESSNVLMCNSVFGACGNSDGLEAAAWSAICGRTPKWGNHVMENRKGTHLFKIECQAETAMDWDVIGYTLGKKLPPHAIPVVDGNFKRPNLIKLKQFFASLATTSGAEMCHIVDLTPEAPTLEIAFGGKEPQEVITITQEDFDESMKNLCDAGSGSVDLVILGCPHYTLEEIRNVALYLKDKKVKEGTQLMVWTDYAIKEMANVNGYTEIIEKAGGHILTSGCPLVIGHKCHENSKGMAMDGAKQAHYIRSETDARVYYGTVYECLDAAVAGKWEEK